MRRRLTILALAALAMLGAPAHAETLRIATWNLGWHVSEAELSPWLAQCGKTYAKDAQGVWRMVPTGTPQAKRGWEIDESRPVLEGVDLSVMPPCAVYLTPAHQGIEVTSRAYEKRMAQIARILFSSVRPDVIAFQEVSGTTAVLEALGALAPDYYVCSFDGAYKIQRLAFAWKRSLGMALEACAVVDAVSLPALTMANRVRPAYTVALELGGKKVRFATVHLKSSCVSPFDGDKLDDNSGPDDPCPILQQQVAPLEAMLEGVATGVDHFIVLGDFNRNLWHEENLVTGAEAVRSDGTIDLTTPRLPNVRTRNLLREVNDATPAASEAVLQPVTCTGSAAIAAACEASKTQKLTSAQMATLTATNALGCRNPVGLDHVLVSKSLAPSVTSTTKIAIGASGRSLGPNPPQFLEPLLAVSDHCPIVVEINF